MSHQFLYVMASCSYAVRTACECHGWNSCMLTAVDDQVILCDWLWMHSVTLAVVASCPVLPKLPEWGCFTCITSDVIQSMLDSSEVNDWCAMLEVLQQPQCTYVHWYVLELDQMWKKLASNICCTYSMNIRLMSHSTRAYNYMNAMV